MQSQRDDVGQFIGFLKTALLIFAGVALFVAAFLIFNTFSITVAQRTREFAMLRTLGANRRQILSSVVIEAFAIGLGAAILGVLAGIGFAPVIGALFKALGIDLPSTGTVIAARTVIVGLLLGTGLTVVAALLAGAAGDPGPAGRGPARRCRAGRPPASAAPATIAAICLIAAGLGLMVARPLRRPRRRPRPGSGSAPQRSCSASRC